MREFFIGESESGQRLDKFLKKLLPGAPLSLIYKLSRTNRAKIDGKKRENDFRLDAGQSVKIFLSEEEFAEFGRNPFPTVGNNGDGNMGALRGEGDEDGKKGAFEKFRLTGERILFEDPFVLVVNKPAGVNVHP